MCNDLINPVGCVAGGVVSSVGSSIFSSLAKWWADAYRSLLSAFSSAFVHAGNISIGQYQSSGLWKLEVGIGLVLAAGGIIWAGARTGWTRSGEPVANALAGLVKAVIGTAVIFTVVTALMASADSITQAIMTATAGSTASFASSLGALSAAGASSSTALVFVFSLLGVIITALLWVEMLVRSAGLVIVTMTAPIGAGGLVQQSTAGWWRKLVAAELALIVIKPVVALVLGVGFTAVGGASGVQGLLVGLMILAASAFAWPTVARLFSFFGSEVASVGLGGALGLAGGLAAARAGSGGLSRGQPMWQTMEAAGRRADPGGGAALGGGAGASGVGGASSAPSALTAASASSPAAPAGSSGIAGAGGAAAGAAGPVGLVAAAGLQAAKKAAEMPGHLLSHAGDMAGVDGSATTSPILEAPLPVGAAGRGRAQGAPFPPSQADPATQATAPAPAPREPGTERSPEGDAS